MLDRYDEIILSNPDAMRVLADACRRRDAIIVDACAELTKRINPNDVRDMMPLFTRVAVLDLGGKP